MSVVVRTALIVAGVSMLMGTESKAIWIRLLSDDFSSNAWTYAGVSNALSQPLIRRDAVGERAVAEWDQGNRFDGSSDPWTIGNSRLSRPLGRTLTDEDTFRFGATVRIDSGSVPDTLEFYQIANFGLYNLAADVVGGDRLQSDNFSGNASLVRDANDLVEFNYFINNESFGFNPFVQGLAIARMPANEMDASPYFVTGTGSDPLFHDTDMGPEQYLPEDTDLYVEVVYYGAATNEAARRVYTAIYDDATRTNLLTVNGVPMYYWTLPVPTGRTFDVDQVALFSYAGVNFTELFGGSTPDGAGMGSFDDVYVDLSGDAGELFEASRSASGSVVLTWAGEPGTNYAVVSSPDLLTGPFITAAVVQAVGPLVSWTGQTSGAMGTYGIRY